MTWYAGGVELEMEVSPDGQLDVSVFDVSAGVEHDDLDFGHPKLQWAIDRLKAN